MLQNKKELYLLHNGSKSKAGTAQQLLSSLEEAIAGQSSSQIVDWNMEEWTMEGQDMECVGVELWC
eukprot:14106429-Ditylum_brightwellii.AAC.1